MRTAIVFGLLTLGACPKQDAPVDALPPLPKRTEIIEHTPEPMSPPDAVSAPDAGPPVAKKKVTTKKRIAKKKAAPKKKFIELPPH